MTDGVRKGIDNRNALHLRFESCFKEKATSVDSHSMPSSPSPPPSQIRRKIQGGSDALATFSQKDVEIEKIKREMEESKKTIEQLEKEKEMLLNLEKERDRLNSIVQVKHRT